MKKISLFVMTLIFSLLFVACQDRKVSEGDLKVSFFTYNNDKINSIANKLVEPGVKIEAPEEPVRVGYTFLGWYTDYKLTNKWDFDEDLMPEHMIILYAGWAEEIFYIYFHVNGSKTTIPSATYDEDTDTWVRQVKVGDKVSTTILSGVTGFDFKGWYGYEPYGWAEGTTESTKPGDKGYSNITIQTANDIHLYSHWTRKSGNYSFNVNYPSGATGVFPGAIGNLKFYYGYTNLYKAKYNLLIDKSEYNMVPDFSDIAADLDYEFIGWNSKADGTGNPILINGSMSTVTTSVTAYAQWKKK